MGHAKMKRYLPAIPIKKFESLEYRIAWWGMVADLATHIKKVSWKGFRKVGKIQYLDNDGKPIYIAGADPYL